MQGLFVNSNDSPSPAPFVRTMPSGRGMAFTPRQTIFTGEENTCTMALLIHFYGMTDVFITCEEVSE